MYSVGSRTAINGKRRQPSRRWSLDPLVSSLNTRIARPATFVDIPTLVSTSLLRPFSRAFSLCLPAFSFAPAFNTMPDWSSPAEVAKDAGVFVKLMHSLLGLYIYEWFLSLDFEWDFISLKKRFRWPMIFYFANRYLLLFALIAITISFDVTTEVDCQSLYTFNQLAGDAALGLASINLSIRTMAIWNQNRYIVGGLILVILGHWSLILQGVQLTVQWVPGQGCTIVKTNNKILAAIFIYSMCFDLIVLLLSMYKLVGIYRLDKKIQFWGGSRLTHMIFEDGLIFFVIAFLANLTATVFMLINLNSIMSVIFNVPAAVASTIVACRAVRRLTNYSTSGPEIYATTGSSHNRPTAGASVVPGTRGVATAKFRTKSGVHVQVRILHSSYSFSPPLSGSCAGLVAVIFIFERLICVDLLYLPSLSPPQHLCFDVHAAQTQMETFTHAEDSQNDLFHKAKAESETDGEDNNLSEAKERF
ncbi:hypothetical protein D9619_008200 [Psilocybe cf. subviscida]|uniref:Transmembrane protein n=1 Tax=Psilocybe cf. subviscida TaxID=2480587 RepID=A0A8H5ATG5_9AGAR|nr:hypothetical protein D9619_008200 [Psilocybe cf. subviscida]